MQVVKCICIKVFLVVLVLVGKRKTNSKRLALKAGSALSVPHMAGPGLLESRGLEPTIANLGALTGQCEWLQEVMSLCRNSRPRIVFFYQRNRKRT